MKEKLNPKKVVDFTKPMPPLHLIAKIADAKNRRQNRLGECRGGVWHWWMDTRIWIAVIAILVLFGVGIIIVNATAEQIGKLATDSFVVAEKQVVDVTRNYFFFDFPFVFLFSYDAFFDKQIN